MLQTTEVSDKDFQKKTPVSKKRKRQTKKDKGSAKKKPKKSETEMEISIVRNKTRNDNLETVSTILFTNLLTCTDYKHLRLIKD